MLGQRLICFGLLQILRQQPVCVDYPNVLLMRSPALTIVLSQAPAAAAATICRLLGQPRRCGRLQM